MTRDEVFESLRLGDTNSGVFAGEWLDAAGADLEVENPATGTTSSRIAGNEWPASPSLGVIWQRNPTDGLCLSKATVPTAPQ